MFIDYTELTFCLLTLESNARNINSYKIIKACFWRSASSEWLIFRRLKLENSLISKKRKQSFDFDNSRKIVKSFKSRHWNEKLNSTNRKQKKKIKNDRNRIIRTETEFKKKRSSKVRESENHETKFEKLKLLEKSFRNTDFKRLITSDKATHDWAHMTLLSFSQSNMMNLLC